MIIKFHQSWTDNKLSCTDAKLEKKTPSLYFTVIGKAIRCRSLCTVMMMTGTLKDKTGQLQVHWPQICSPNLITNRSYRQCSRHTGESEMKWRTNVPICYTQALQLCISIWYGWRQRRDLSPSPWQWKKLNL